MKKEELKQIRSFLKKHRHLNLNWSKQCLANQMLRGHQIVVRWEDGTTEIPDICAAKICELFADCAFDLLSKSFRENLNLDKLSKLQDFISGL